MPENSPHSTTDVIVLGAGVAGLTATRDLSAAGLRVAVVEARSRVGGRIFTQRNPSAVVPIELGAEFVHGRPSETLKIAETAGLKICDTCGRHWFQQGKDLVKSSEFYSTLDEVMALMKSVGARDHSFREFLEEHCKDPQIKSIATLFVQGFHAAQTDRISVQGLNLVNEATDRIDGDSRSRILDGYDQVVQWLREQSVTQGAEFHINAIVNEVRWSRNHVEVLTADGSVFESRCAVVTFPLGVLQAESVRFIPELTDKTRSAKVLAMGQVIKVVCVFRERFWEQLNSFSELCYLHAPEQTIPTWWTQLPVRAPVLVGWTGGPTAEKLLQNDDRSITEAALESLRRILGIARKNLDELLVSTYTHNWQQDRFSRGAYSYIPVGGLTAPAELAAAVNNTLFFAGEATNTEGHGGTVHGAIATGHRAAREVLETRQL